MGPAPGLLMLKLEPQDFRNANACLRGWTTSLRGAELPARPCTDAHLAALTIANGWRLVSFDRDFERFEGLVRLPLP